MSRISTSSCTAGTGRPERSRSVWRRERVVELGDAAAASEILALVPPAALESCEVPLWEVKAWLSGATAAVDGGDVEGGTLSEVAIREPRSATKVLRWDGVEEGVTAVDIERLRPGDVIVLTSARGGYDAFGWNPGSTARVPDIADQAYAARTGRTIERIDDAEADVDGDRVRRWSDGVVVETLSSEQRGRRGGDIEVLLGEHPQAVAERARSYAQHLGLDPHAAYVPGLHQSWPRGEA